MNEAEELRDHIMREHPSWSPGPEHPSLQELQRIHDRAHAKE